MPPPLIKITPDEHGVYNAEQRADYRNVEEYSSAGVQCIEHHRAGYQNIRAVPRDHSVRRGGAFDEPVYVHERERREQDGKYDKLLHFHILLIHFSMVPFIISPAFSRSVSDTSIQWI